MINNRTIVDKNNIKTNTVDSFGFFLLIIFLFIEYGRPMDIVSGLESLRPGMIVSILLMLSWILRGNIAQAKSWQTLMVILFILLLAVYIPFAVNNFFAYELTKRILLYMPFFLSAIIYINSFKRLKQFFYIWVLLMIYMSLKGLLGKGIAGSSFLADENDFSLLMNMMLPFSFFLFMYEKLFIKKMFYLTAFILAILSIVASSSRGGFVGLLAVLAVIWLFSPKKILSLVFIGILAGAVYYSTDQKYWDEMSTIQDTEGGTAKERFDSWKAAWDMFKDNPLGVGGGNFLVRFPEYQPEGMQRNMWGREAHSLWFTLLSELGAIGALIYGFLLIFNLRDIFWLKGLKNKPDDNFRYAYFLSLAFLGSFAGYFASGTFLSVLYYPHYFYITAMIVVTIKRIEQEKIDLKI